MPNILEIFRIQNLLISSHRKELIKMIISVNLSDEDAEWIKVYAERNNISSSKLIRNIVLEKIENEYDIECYKKVIKEYNENPQTYTLEDVKEELGLL